MVALNTYLRDLVRRGNLSLFSDPNEFGRQLSTQTDGSVLQNNMLIRCATYDLLPKTTFLSESSMKQYSQSLVLTLTEKHGIRYENAESIACLIGNAFMANDTTDSYNKEQMSAHDAPEKQKKKGLFSIFKKG